MPHKVSDGDWALAIQSIHAYGMARKEFRAKQESLPLLLGGNDNKVGVSGEFWAKKYYVDRGYEITEVPNSNNEGYDFKCASGEQQLRISVKVITKESKTGRQLRLKKSNQWDELLMVLLTEELSPYCFGRVTRSQFRQAINDKKIGEQPFMDRRNCNDRGWINRYGQVQKIG
jgi:hypothetical protein